MGDIAEQQNDIMSLANSIPVVVHWFMSRRLIICNDFEGAKRTNGEAVTTRRDEVEHTVDVIFDHPRWPTYWLTIGRRRSPICEFCSVVPTKRLLTSDHLRRESLFTDWSSKFSVGKASTASIRQLDRYIVSGCAALSTSVPICRELRNHGDFLAPPAFSFSTSNEIGVFVVLKTWGTLCLLTWGRRERKSLSSLRHEHFSSETASRLKVCRDDGIGEDDIV